MMRQPCCMGAGLALVTDLQEDHVGLDLLELPDQVVLWAETHIHTHTHTYTHTIGAASADYTSPRHNHGSWFPPCLHPSKHTQANDTTPQAPSPTNPTQPFPPTPPPPTPTLR
jgi:hypothetical protein